MKRHFVFALVGMVSMASPSWAGASSPSESVSVTPISLVEGLKAFDAICLANFPNESAFQTSVQASPLKFKRVKDGASATHNKWRSEFASAIYVRQNGNWPISVLPQCNIEFLVDPASTDDEIVRALDRTLEARLGAEPSRKQVKFGVRWKWRQNRRRVHLDLIRNDRTSAGQVTLSLQPN